MYNFDIIDKHNEARIAEGKNVGATCIINVGGKKVYEKCYGLADIPNNKPITPDNLFRLASMSKPITGIAVMQLVEQGKIGLFDDISKYIPELHDFNLGIYDEKTGNVTIGEKARRGINVFQLLNHCSGLGQAMVGFTYMDKFPKKYRPQSGETLADVTPRYHDYPLDCNPGDAFGYGAHIPFDLLGRIVEVASDMKFSDYLKKYITDPLGMTDTTFHMTDEQRSRLVKLYYAPHLDGKDGDISEDPMTTNFGGYPESYEGGSCALIGSARDYSKIAEMFLNYGTLDGVKILNEDTVRLMSTPLIRPTMPGYNHNELWGLSMRVVTSLDPNYPLLPGTFGWSGAYGTHFIVCPSHNFTAVYFANLSNAGGSGAPASLEFEKDVTKVIRESV